MGSKNEDTHGPFDSLALIVKACPVHSQEKRLEGRFDKKRFIRTDISEEVSEVCKNSDSSIEKLKRELMEANRSRDAALTQVEEMKSSLGEFSDKLQYLESYCDSLKKALVSRENSEMPVSEDVMVERFLQIVSESRLSIKQLLKTLITEIDAEDSSLISNINILLQPHNLSFSSKYSKIIQYRLEAIISILCSC